MTKPAAPLERVHYLDWLKAVIVYGIFLYHVALVFAVVPWLISNPEHSLALSAFAGFAFPWGIPAMFLIAGADAWFGSGARSPARYVAMRCLRLLVPLAAGMTLLTPFQRWVTGSGPLTPEALAATYVAFLTHPTWDPLHLWFLGYLFAISVPALPLLIALRTPAGERVVGGLVAIARRRGGLVALAAPLCASQVLLRPRFPAYQGWADVATYSIVFLWGAVVASRRDFEPAIRRDAWALVALGSTASVALAAIAYGTPGHAAPTAASAPLLATAYSAAWSLDIWAWLLVLVGVGVRWLDFPNPVMKYMSDSVLPFYVIHHPAVLVAATLVVPLSLPVWPKFALVVGFALPATLLIYELGIRRWRLTRAVFGLKPRPSAPRAVLTRPAPAG